MTLPNNASRALLALTLLIPGTAWAASSLPSTPYTRSVLRAADAPAARTALGIANSNWSVNVAQFTVGAGSQLTISTQALMTNVNIFGSIDKVSNIVGESNANTWYVRPDGNDATAVKGNPRFAFASISNAVARATNNEVVMVMPGVYTNDNTRRYRAANTASHAWINIYKKTNFVLTGVGMPTIYDKNYTNTCAVVYGSSGVTISGIRWQGINSNYNHAAGFVIHGALEYAEGTERLTVEGCEFLDGQDFAIVDSSSSVPSTNAIVVRRNFFRNYGNWYPTGLWWDGGAFAGVGEFCDNISEGCTRTVEFFPMPASGLAKQKAVARNNTIYNCMFEGITDGGSGQLADVHVHGNTIYQNAAFLRGGPGTPLGGSGASTLINFNGITNLSIVNNTLIGASNVAIQVTSGTNVVIQNNTISPKLGLALKQGIVLDHVGTVTMTGNSVRGARDAGAGLFWSKGVFAANNNFSDLPSGSRGFTLYLMTNSVFMGNMVEGNSGAHIIQGSDVSPGIIVGRNYSFGPTVRYYDNGTAANTNYTFEANEAP